VENKLKTIITEIVVLLLCIAFLVFLARDDRKNRRARDEEDRQKALQQAEVDSRQD